MINVDILLKFYFQTTAEQNTKPFMKAASFLLKKFIYENEINHFIETHKHLEGLEFTDAVLENFNFIFQVSNKDRARIPDHDRVKVIATSLLSHFDPLHSLFLTVDSSSKKVSRCESMLQITRALEAGQAAIIFPRCRDFKNSF